MNGVTYWLTLQDELPIQRPTVPGKVDGIVGWEPCVLQCRVCGVTTTQERSSVAAFIILSGFEAEASATASGCEGEGLPGGSPDAAGARGRTA